MTKGCLNGRKNEMLYGEPELRPRLESDKEKAIVLVYSPGDEYPVGAVFPIYDFRISLTDKCFPFGTRFKIGGVIYSVALKTARRRETRHIVKGSNRIVEYWTTYQRVTLIDDQGKEWAGRYCSGKNQNERKARNGNRRKRNA